MTPYSEWRPSQFDTAGLGLEDRQDWLVPGVAQNRDSGHVTRANFDAFQRELTKVDPEGNDHELHRFGHWGNGWFEIFIVRPETPAAKEAEAMANAIEEYCILDDSLYSEYENEEVESYWKNMSTKERVEILSKRKLNIMAARRDSYPEGMYDWLSDRVAQNG